MPQFTRYLGIDYSGAQTPSDSLPGLRVYEATTERDPVEIPPSPAWRAGSLVFRNTGRRAAGQRQNFRYCGTALAERTVTIVNGSPTTPAFAPTQAIELLSRARGIWAANEATREHGELFNLLTIIRRGHLEMMTHSPILAELLRPTGTHGFGADFLSRFLQQLGIKDFEAGTATVGEEVSCGKLGRIDLVLTDRTGHRVFIENKIDARLQERQLERYQAAAPDAWVVYLTPHGSPPPDTDTREVPKLKLMSYRDDIVSWLDACRNVCAKSPTVYHAIGQYRTLVVELTSQNLSTQMSKDLAAAVMTNVESFRAFYALIAAKQEIQHALAKKLSRAVVREVADLALIQELSGTGIAYKDAFKQPIILPATTALDAEFSFESSDFSGCYFGFRLRGGELPEFDRGTLRALFEEEFGVKAIHHPEWPCWAYWQIRNWTDDVWSNVLTDNLSSFAGKIATTLRGLDKVGRKLQEKLRAGVV